MRPEDNRWIVHLDENVEFGKPCGMEEAEITDIYLFCH